ncbi:MAG TPA: hypothetical protein ENJ99_07165 [Rhizobiales bacterium]|nr:hypothetical protein [Hyphomicrobiales bacterium]
MQTHRAIASEIMSAKSPKQRNWQAWSENNAAMVARVQKSMDELMKGRGFDLARLAVAASQLSDMTSL